MSTIQQVQQRLRKAIFTDRRAALFVLSLMPRKPLAVAVHREMARMRGGR